MDTSTALQTLRHGFASLAQRLPNIELIGIVVTAANPLCRKPGVCEILDGWVSRHFEQLPTIKYGGSLPLSYLGNDSYTPAKIVEYAFTNRTPESNAGFGQFLNLCDTAWQKIRLAKWSENPIGIICEAGDWEIPSPDGEPMSAEEARRLLSDRTAVISGGGRCPQSRQWLDHLLATQGIETQGSEMLVDGEIYTIRQFRLPAPVFVASCAAIDALETKPTDLDEGEQEIVQAIRLLQSKGYRLPTAQQIAQKIPRENNSNFRAKLGRMVERNTLKKGPNGRGYSVT